MKEDFKYIDELLAELEDVIHGEISDRITIARGKIQALSIADVSNKRELLIAYEKSLYSNEEWFVAEKDLVKTIDVYISNL